MSDDAQSGHQLHHAAERRRDGDVHVEPRQDLVARIVGGDPALLIALDQLLDGMAERAADQIVLAVEVVVDQPDIDLAGERDVAHRHRGIMSLGEQAQRLVEDERPALDRIETPPHGLRRHFPPCSYCLAYMLCCTIVRLALRY